MTRVALAILLGAGYLVVTWIVLWLLLGPDELGGREGRR